MSWGLVAVAGATLVAGVVNAQSAKSAAAKQAAAAQNAANSQASVTQQQMAQQQAMYDANVARMNPYVQAGQGALAQLQRGVAPGGQFMQTFSPANFQQDPSYQWRLQQGEKALQSSAAAKGLLGTGQGLRDITNYGQNAASQEYQAAYNRFQDTNNTLFNRLTTVAGNSQNAAAGLGAQGTQVSSNLANTAMSGIAAQNNYMTSAAAAQAAGQIGQANALSSTVGSLGNYYMQYQLMKQNQQPPTTSTYPSTYQGPGSGFVNNPAAAGDNYGP